MKLDRKKRKKVSMPPLPLTSENQENSNLLANRAKMKPHIKVYSSNSNLISTLRSKSTSSKASKRYEQPADEFQNSFDLPTIPNLPKLNLNAVQGALNTDRALKPVQPGTLELGSSRRVNVEATPQFTMINTERNGSSNKEFFERRDTSGETTSFQAHVAPKESSKAPPAKHRSTSQSGKSKHE